MRRVCRPKRPRKDTLICFPHLPGPEDSLSHTDPLTLTSSHPLPPSQLMTPPQGPPPSPLPIFPLPGGGLSGLSPGPACMYVPTSPSPSLLPPSVSLPPPSFCLPLPLLLCFLSSSISWFLYLNGAPGLCLILHLTVCPLGLSSHFLCVSPSPSPFLTFFSPTLRRSLAHLGLTWSLGELWAGKVKPFSTQTQGSSWGPEAAPQPSPVERGVVHIPRVATVVCSPADPWSHLARPFVCCPHTLTAHPHAHPPPR